MHIASISIRSGQNHLSPALPMSATVADAVRSPLEFGLRPSRYQTASSVPGCASNSLNALARFFVYTLFAEAAVTFTQREREQVIPFHPDLQ
jgi:hypothetical protein